MPDQVNPSPDKYGYSDTGGGWDYYDSGTGNKQNSGTGYDTKTCKLVLKYYANGASGNPPSNSIITYSGGLEKVTLNATVKDQGTTMTRSGYYFLGWSDVSGSSLTIKYDPGQIISKEWTEKQSGTTTYNLYAVWSNHGRFVYKPGEYAKEKDDEYCDKYSDKPLNEAVNLKGAVYTRTGYTQTGWKLANGTHIGNVGESYTSTTADEMVLYPEWTANQYTLTFKANGATGLDITQQVYYDSEITMPDAFVYINEGYHIFAWNEKSDGTESSWFPGKKYKFTRDSNITLYAIWLGNEYYVVYDDSEDGSIPEVTGVIDYSACELDSNNYIFSDSYNLALDSEDLLDTRASNFIIDTNDDRYNYAIAVYGSTFYTEYRPAPRENMSFAGWKTSDGIRLVKSDYCMDAYSLESDSIWRNKGNVILTPIWSGKYPYGKFFYGRRESTSYNIVVEEPPDYYWPEREYTHTKVKGRNGDILSDPNRYENVQKKYKIAVYNKTGFTKAASDFSGFLHRYNGYSDYIRLEDSYEPDVYMLGIYEEANSLTNILGKAGRAEITFNCKPQKYLISGNRSIDIIKPDGNSIWNLTDYPALPIITIWGTGTIQFFSRPTRRIQGGTSQVDPGASELKRVDLKVLDNYNEIILDCETFNAVDINGKNMNPYISLSEPIVLHPGPNGIRYSGNIERVSITPRWWRL